MLLIVFQNLIMISTLISTCVLYYIGILSGLIVYNLYNTTNISITNAYVLFIFFILLAYISNPLIGVVHRIQNIK
jgi:hypothetical protein